MVMISLIITVMDNGALCNELTSQLYCCMHGACLYVWTFSMCVHSAIACMLIMLTTQ